MHIGICWANWSTTTPCEHMLELRHEGSSWEGFEGSGLMLLCPLAFWTEGLVGWVATHTWHDLMLQLGQEEKENNSVQGKEHSSLLRQTWVFAWILQRERPTCQELYKMDLWKVAYYKVIGTRTASSGPTGHPIAFVQLLLVWSTSSPSRNYIVTNYFLWSNTCGKSSVTLQGGDHFCSCCWT